MKKPMMTHVVITGRNASEELIEIADMVDRDGADKAPFFVRVLRRKLGWSFNGEL